MGKFYRGCIVEQVKQYGVTGEMVMVVVTDVLSMDLHIQVGTNIAVEYKLLEPVVDEVFTVGDNVMSLLGHHTPFTGIIVGFEYKTNSAICMSSKIESYADRRVRYAYKPTELQLHDDAYIVFEPGKYYRVNQDFEVLAVNKDGMVWLYHASINSDKPFSIVNEREFKPMLAIHHGIYSIQQVRGPKDEDKRTGGRNNRSDYFTRKRKRNTSNQR